MSTDWAKFATIKAVKIIAYILIALFALITFYGLFTNKPIKIWVIEFNRKDTVYKYVLKTNTTNNNDSAKNIIHMGDNKGNMEIK